MCTLLPAFTPRRQTRPALAASPPGCPSALVEEASLRDPGLVLGRYFDIGRGKQEHLVRNALDAPAQSEDQSRGEIDQTLSVAVDHLREIHDHRSALTEVLSDRT